MSLLPTAGSVISEALPVLFLEARVSGNAHQFITQMGVSIDADQCSVGMLTRTSGVLLIAGFGSYCAYRIANKYLGKGFVWTIFDGAHCDLLAKSDVRLLHPIPGCSSDDDRRTIISVDEFDDDDEEADGQRTPVSSKNRRRALRISGPDGRFIKLIDSPFWRAVADANASKKGLAGLTSSPPTRSGSEIRRRSECCDDLSSVGGSSSISVASRIRRIGRTEVVRLEKEDMDDDEEDDAMSTAPTEASGIRLMWDGDACWDDEFEHFEEGATQNISRLDDQLRGKSPTPSDISEMSAFKTLQSMFDSGQGPSHASDVDNEGSMFGDASDLAQMIHSKCMRSSKYMYHSVIVASSDVDGSDVVSVCSGRSTTSNMSALKEKYKKQSHGLWELASRSHEKPSTSSIFLDTPMASSNPMTDSGISKSSAGSSIQAKVQNQKKNSNQMTDSAIDTGFASSDDDAGSIKSLSVKKPSGILRRTNLMDGIKEQPSPVRRRIEASSKASVRSLGAVSKSSDKSLEWFDDDS